MAGYIGSKAVLLSTTAATVTGDMTVDTSTLKVDSSNNRVGIGTASPSHPFHLITSTDGTGVSGDDTWAALIRNAEATDGRSYGLKIQAGSTTDQALGITDHDGSNDLMAVDGTGRVTMPKQPCFYVVTGTASAASSGATYIGSNGTGGTSSNSANTNIGSHFAVADGKFTAPVGGQYLFFASASQSTTTTGPGLGFWKNGSLESMIAYGYGMNYMSFSHQTIMTLAANDYVQAVFAHYNSVSSALYTSSFGGHLIG